MWFNGWGKSESILQERVGDDMGTRCTRLRSAVGRGTRGEGMAEGGSVEVRPTSTRPGAPVPLSSDIDIAMSDKGTDKSRFCPCPNTNVMKLHCAVSYC